MESASTVFDSLADLVGNTPLVRLDRFAPSQSSRLLAKCEFLNPGGSVKDRIAFNMIKRAEESGALQSGGTIVEATAGNTGIGLALAAALKNYKLVAVMSEKVSKDKVQTLRSLGAETVVVPSGKPRTDPDHFMNRALRIAQERNGWLADQFNNEHNIEAHYQSTGPEIWRQTGGVVDVLVAGVGTGGTLTGTGRFLKEMNPSLKIVLADPVGSMLADLVMGRTTASSSYLVEGIGQDFIPGNFDTSLVDEVISVSDNQSVAASHALLETEGMFVGSSSGCIAHASLEYIRKVGNASKEQTIVAILPDGGRGYMSTIYDPEWLDRNLPK